MSTVLAPPSPRQRPVPRGLLLSIFLGVLALGLAVPPAAGQQVIRERVQITPGGEPASSGASLNSTSLEATTSRATRVYYVSPRGNDENPGTPEAPWRTFAKAARTLVAGDVAVFEDGTYIETEISSLFNNGTAERPIVFRARNTHKARLLFNPRNSAQRNKTKIRIYGEHVTIQGFEITQDRMGTNSSDIFITCTPGANYCTIRDNKIHRAWEECAKAYGYKTGIRGVLIEGNLCEDTKDGFDFVNVESSIVRGNTIINRSRTDASTALMLKGGIRNVQVYDNYIYVDAPGSKMLSAIQLGGYTGSRYAYDPNGYECYNSVAWNNVIHVNVRGTVRHGLGLYGASDCAYVNNVVIGANYGFVAQRGGVSSKTRNAYFKNNILVDLVRGATRFKTSEMEGRLVHDHNLYYNTPGAPKEPGGVYADPRFVDKHGDWRLRPGSPALGRGQALKPFPAFRGAKTAGAPAIDTAKDRAGNKRTSPWDIGAFAHQAGAQQAQVEQTSNAVLLTSPDNRIEFTLEGAEAYGTVEVAVVEAAAGITTTPRVVRLDGEGVAAFTLTAGQAVSVGEPLSLRFAIRAEGQTLAEREVLLVVEAPEQAALEVNYPNPFHPRTTIGFMLPSSSDVTLTVYDAVGREVARLVDGELGAGFHEAHFDGSGLASGPYFYRLIAEGAAGRSVMTKRMTLVK